MPYQPGTVTIPADAFAKSATNQAIGTIRMAVEASETEDMGYVAHILATHLNSLLRQLWIHEGENATVDDLVTLAADNGLSPMGFRDPRI
jgi:hypothetical protein